MPPRRAPKRAVWRRHRVWPWAVAAAALALAASWQLLRPRADVTPSAGPVAGEAAPPQRLEPKAKAGVPARTESPDPGGLLTVAVVDARGLPVSDCAAQLRLPGQRQVAVVSEAASCEAVELGEVPAGDYLLAAVAPGFRRAERPVHLAPGPSALRLTLEDGVALSGRVVDESGRPQPGVSVLASPTGAVARTDGTGAFRLFAPGPGLYTLEAHHSDLGGVVRSVNGPATDVLLRLEPRSVLELTVQLSSGQPVEGAQTLLFDGRDSGPGGQYEADRSTDSAGMVRLKGLPAGRYTLGVVRPGSLLEARQQVVLREGHTTAVTLTLPPPPSGTVEGEVVDEAGKRVAGALVRAEPPDLPTVQTDARGRFSVPGVPEGLDYQLVALFDAVASAPRRVRAGNTEVRLLLPAARSYRGRVLDEAHSAVPVFRLGTTEVQAADGRFVVSLRPTQPAVSLTVEAPGLSVATLVRPREAEEVGDIVLHPAPRVQGRVQERDGGPAAGALVVCEGCRGEKEDERHLTALADGGGHFTLAVTGAHGVLVRLLALRDDRVGWAEAGRVGEEAVLTLAPPAKVQGRVVRPDGKLAAGVAVVFSEPLLEPLLLVTRADGSFSGEVPPGLYQLTLSPDSSRPRRTWTVELPSQAPLELSVGASP